MWKIISGEFTGYKLDRSCVGPEVERVELRCKKIDYRGPSYDAQYYCQKRQREKEKEIRRDMSSQWMLITGRYCKPNVELET